MALDFVGGVLLTAVTEWISVDGSGEYTEKFAG